MASSLHLSRPNLQTVLPFSITRQTEPVATIPLFLRFLSVHPI